MAYTNFISIAILFLLLLTCRSATGDDVFNLAPLFSPVFDNVCKEVECGKGSCKPSMNSTFFFHCECEPGWSQSLSKDQDNDYGFKFLPCIIPNCSVDFSCTNTKSPVQEKEKPQNTSVFDPCSWADCGGGKCNTTSQFTYSCQCEENYYNLLNTTSLPCLKECSLGMDCSNLGISIIKPPPSSQPPTLSDKNSNQASAMPGGVFEWLAQLVMLVLVI